MIRHLEHPRNAAYRMDVVPHPLKYVNDLLPRVRLVILAELVALQVYLVADSAVETNFDSY